MISMMMLIPLWALASLVAGETGLEDSDLEYSRTIYVVENIPRLSVEAELTNVVARRGGNVTLPCRFHRDQSAPPNRKIRIKWTKLTEDFLREEVVLVATETLRRSFGRFRGRASLPSAFHSGDASLSVAAVTLDDHGAYACEVVDGLDDGRVAVRLDLLGVVFPYSVSRYALTLADARRACRDNDARLATPEQLTAAWRGGMDWCNAGWLGDGSVRFPIRFPREKCGGRRAPPGIRSYGKGKGRSYDAFCFTAEGKGRFYFLVHPSKLTFDEGAAACRLDGARMANVGQMFAAWKLRGYDRCDPGWLSDGSVRYPVAKPRPRCSPGEAAVRLVGFPDKKQKLYGVYCFKGDE